MPIVSLEGSEKKHSKVIFKIKPRPSPSKYPNPSSIEILPFEVLEEKCKMDIFVDEGYILTNILHYCTLGGRKNPKGYLYKNSLSLFGMKEVVLILIG